MIAPVLHLVLFHLGVAGDGPAPTIHLIDDRGRGAFELAAGDTVRVHVTGAKALAAYDLLLVDDADNVLGLTRAAAATDGSLGPEVLWWNSGVTGPDPNGHGDGGEGFQTFEEARSFLAAHKVTAELREADLRDPGNGKLVASRDVAFDVDPRARLWFSDSEESYRTAFDAGVEPIYVTGKDLPPGATIELYVVADRAAYTAGEALVDVTGFQGASHKKTVYLASDSTSFSVPVWPSVYQFTGRFDLVARVNAPPSAGRGRVADEDLVFGGLETGLEVRPEPSLAPSAPKDHETQLAGKRTLLLLPPGFRYLDVFLRHDVILAALDPSDLGSEHKGGDYASIYVVPSRTKAKWHSNPAIGADLTETVEYRKVKPGTLELSIGAIWLDASPAADATKCDVVLDFGSDGNYDPGIDVIDRLDANGFAIVDDPADFGPYPVGRAEYDFPDVYDIPWGDFKDKKVDVRAVVAYPGVSAGIDVDVWGDPKKPKEFPLIAILHGNHNVCLSGGCTCSTGRIPNHEGYDYLLDLWASHGFIAVSIDGYDITGCPTDRFIERGALILEHLQYWKEWNDKSIPDDTFSGRFFNHVKMKNIGIAGHSRGGEGVAAAVQINQDLALGFDIEAAILIAPTDYNWSAPPGGGPIEFLIRDVPTFNILGSSDGDVSDLQGAQLYDRASPPGRRATKSQSLIYGADHNSWNTVWIDPAWNGGSEGVGGGRISAQKQQDTGRVFFTSWWMAWLQGKSEMLAFHQDDVRSARLTNVNCYWTYEPADRVDFDDFEQLPSDKKKNTLGGANDATPTPLTWQENRLEPGDYDGSFFQDTRGVIVEWDEQTDYVATIPTANRDVSAYTYLSLRATQIFDSLNPAGSQRFLIDVEDEDGRRGVIDVDSRGFTTIPVGYNHPFTGRKSMLSSVRIPLRAFTQDNSDVDLTRIAKVIITFEDSGLMAIDGLQFTK